MTWLSGLASANRRMSIRVFLNVAEPCPQGGRDSCVTGGIWVIESSFTRSVGYGSVCLWDRWRAGESEQECASTATLGVVRGAVRSVKVGLNGRSEREPSAGRGDSLDALADRSWGDAISGCPSDAPP